jgi:hypothetical protein
MRCFVLNSQEVHITVQDLSGLTTFGAYCEGVRGISNGKKCYRGYSDADVIFRTFLAEFFLYEYESIEDRSMTLGKCDWEEEISALSEEMRIVKRFVLNPLYATRHVT